MRNITSALARPFIISKKESERQGENKTYDSPSQHYDILLYGLGFPQTRATTLSPAILDHQIKSIKEKLVKLEAEDLSAQTNMANKLNQAGKLTVYITAFIAFIAFVAVVATGISAGAPFVAMFQVGGSGAAFFTANGTNLLAAVVVGKVVQEGSRYSIDSTNKKHELKKEYLQKDIQRGEALQEKLKMREKFLSEATNKTLITELNDALKLPFIPKIQDPQKEKSLSEFMQSGFGLWDLLPKRFKTTTTAEQTKKLYDAAKYIKGNKYVDLTDKLTQSTKSKMSKVTPEMMDILLANHVKLSDPNVTNVFKISDKYYAQYAPASEGAAGTIKAIDKDSGKISDQEIQEADIAAPESLAGGDLTLYVGDTTLSKLAQKLAKEESPVVFKCIPSPGGAIPAKIFRLQSSETIDGAEQTAYEEAKESINELVESLAGLGLADLMPFLENDPGNIEAYISDLKSHLAGEHYDAKIEENSAFNDFLRGLDDGINEVDVNDVLDKIDPAIIKTAIEVTRSTTTYDVNDEELVTKLNRQIEHERGKAAMRTNISLDPNDFNEAIADTQDASKAMIEEVQDMLGTRNDLGKLEGMQPGQSLSRAARASGGGRGLG